MNDGRALRIAPDAKTVAHSFVSFAEFGHALAFHDVAVRETTSRKMRKALRGPAQKPRPPWVRQGVMCDG